MDRVEQQDLAEPAPLAAKIDGQPPDDGRRHGIVRQSPGERRWQIVLFEARRGQRAVAGDPFGRIARRDIDPSGSTVSGGSSTEALAVAARGPPQRRVRRGRVEQRVVKGVPIRRREHDPLSGLDHPLGRGRGIVQHEAADRGFLAGRRAFELALAPGVEAKWTRSCFVSAASAITMSAA